VLRLVESLSWRSRYILTGDRRSFCAHAWDNRDKWYWALHVAIWDRVFWRDPHHCRRVAAYWRNHDRAA